MTEAHHRCAFCGVRYGDHHEDYSACPTFTLATVPLPAGCTPDPLDQAAVRVLPDATAAAAEVDSHMVRLSDAKRIRDEACQRSFEHGAIHAAAQIGEAFGPDLDAFSDPEEVGR